MTFLVFELLLWQWLCIYFSCSLDSIFIEGFLFLGHFQIITSNISFLKYNVLEFL